MIEPENEFNQEYIPPIKKSLNIPVFKLIIFVSLIIILLIFLIRVFSLQEDPFIYPEGTPEPENYYPRPTSSIQIQPSYLATDAAVLKTKSDVEANINSANTLDLSESNLSFPILDFNIGFE